jgi:exonuclease VII small subunit
MLADTSTISILTSVLPQIAIIAALSGLIGWSIRGKFTKQPAAKPAAAAPQSRDRSKNLEAALEKSKESLKTLKSEHDALKASAVSSASLEKANAELDAARNALDSGTKRISALEADLKKAQDTIKNLNGRANDADKSQKDRSFALENELSKTRQQLAQLEARPDDTAVLHAEIERLRESVAVSTRYAGEVRKREVAATEALEKAQAQLAEAGNAPRAATVVSKKVGPVGDSDRVAAAKAEVLRLLESNKQAVAVVEKPIVAVDESTEAVNAPNEAVDAPVNTADEPNLAGDAPIQEVDAPIVAAEEPNVAGDTSGEVVEAQHAAVDTPIVAVDEPETSLAEQEDALADPDAVASERPAAPKKAPVHAELFALE